MGVVLHCQTCTSFMVDVFMQDAVLQEQAATIVACDHVFQVMKSVRAPDKSKMFKCLLVVTAGDGRVLAWYPASSPSLNESDEPTSVAGLREAAERCYKKYGKVGCPS